MSNRCLDINVGDIESPLIMSTCHGRGGNQFFALTTNQMIVTSQENCVGANDQLYAVVSVNCIDRTLHSWKFDSKVGCIQITGRRRSHRYTFTFQNKWLQHISSGRCMMANRIEVVLVKCDPANGNLVWDINLRV